MDLPPTAPPQDPGLCVSIAAEDGWLRSRSRVDLPETLGLERRGLGIRADELVLLDARAHARRDAAHQQVGAGRGARGGNPRARGAEGVEAGDLVEAGSVAVV